MVDQAQLLEGVVLRCRDRVDIEVEGEDAGQTPLFNGCLDLGRPHQIRRPIRASLLDGNVVVRTSDLVLGAVLALREALVTSDVPLLASFATLARLGMAKESKSVCHISNTKRVQRKRTFVEEDRRRDQPLLQTLMDERTVCASLRVIRGREPMNHGNGDQRWIEGSSGLQCSRVVKLLEGIPDGGLGQGGASEATARQNVWQTSGGGLLLETSVHKLLPWSYSLSFLLESSERGWVDGC